MKNRIQQIEAARIALEKAQFAVKILVSSTACTFTNQLGGLACIEASKDAVMAIEVRK